MADDRNAPATKGDLADLRDELMFEIKGESSGLRAEFKSEISGLRDELVEVIRDSQTEVLKALYGFSQTIQERFRQVDASETAFRNRLATVEERLLEVEKRLNMPPNAA